CGDDFSSQWTLGKAICVVIWISAPYEAHRVLIQVVLQKLRCVISPWIYPALWMCWRAAFIFMRSVWLICSSSGMALPTGSRARSHRIPKNFTEAVQCGDHHALETEEPRRCGLHRLANLLHRDSARHQQLCRQPGGHVSRRMVVEITHLPHNASLHGERS
ncbi:hypothetical protein PILCRDRAFT_786726, partial [Piloderma croceum F 1598]